MALSFANIVMAEVETDTINQNPYKALIWKRYIDDIFSLWNINNFIGLANSYHPTINSRLRFQIYTEITFLDTYMQIRLKIQKRRKAPYS